MNEPKTEVPTAITETLAEIAALTARATQPISIPDLAAFETVYAEWIAVGGKSLRGISVDHPLEVAYRADCVAAYLKHTGKKRVPKSEGDDESEQFGWAFRGMREGGEVTQKLATDLYAIYDPIARALISARKERADFIRKHLWAAANLLEPEKTDEFIKIDVVPHNTYTQISRFHYAEIAAQEKADKVIRAGAEAEVRQVWGERSHFGGTSCYGGEAQVWAKVTQRSGEALLMRTDPRTLAEQVGDYMKSGVDPRVMFCGMLPNNYQEVYGLDDFGNVRPKPVETVETEDAERVVAVAA